MSKVYSKALDSSIEVGRYIGKFESDTKLPTVVFFGGIHGNEPSGVFALNEVCKHITNNSIPLNGSLYAISGNLCALPDGNRFCDIDLNRIWTRKKITDLVDLKKDASTKEDTQLLEILKEIKEIVSRAEGPIYFIDLHTTSSESCPFIPINDTMANRSFAQLFPVPTVLGIEEFLDGPLLSYINEIDHIALGFEGGQHDAKDSIKHHIGFVSLVLLYSGLINKGAIPDYQKYVKSLELASAKDKGIYEIIDRYEIKDNQKFQMKKGFRSFDAIQKKQPLAVYGQRSVNARYSGKIFMPLYQAQGEDGFFIIRSISPLWLALSSFLRKYRFEGLLVILPGIGRDKNNSKTILVNKTIARFLSKDIFHLLGFRMKSKGEVLDRYTRREKL
ncbi:MAG: aspartoacylase [Salibacteraceae bacterium]